MYSVQVYTAQIPCLLKIIDSDGCFLLTLPYQGGGCGLMTRTRKFEEIIKGMNYVSAHLLHQLCMNHFYLLFFS